MRALVVTNMWPSPERPARGSFVRDQVRAVAAIDGVSVDVFAFRSGTAQYPRAAARLRRALAGRRFDVVHAHFGLTAWPALAASASAHLVTLHGTDLHDPRSRAVTRAALPLMTLPATVSRALAGAIAGAGRTRRVAVLPIGVATDRFRPVDRADARRRLGLAVDGRYLLFPSDPGRPGKRHDRALAIAGDAEVLAAGAVAPEEMPLWVNAANAVVVPSDHEGYGLATLEALACDVPVLATPVGIAPLALRGVDGALCAPFDVAAWRAALAPHLREADPRIAGRARAELFSAGRMAARVVATWRALASPDADRGPAR